MEPDIIEQVRADFLPDTVSAALARIEAVTSSSYLQRCIVFAARGHPWYFAYLCRHLKTYDRDIILAAQHIWFDIQLYDLTRPIPQARLDGPADGDWPGSKGEVEWARNPSMTSEADVIERVHKEFAPELVPSILTRLQKAAVDCRTQRCIVFAARGHLGYFSYLCRLSRRDYRDVFLLAEYSRCHVLLYNFNRPFRTAGIKPFGGVTKL